MKAVFIALFIALCGIAAHAQIKHAATATVTIQGNCEQCKHTIETAAAADKNAAASWNSKTQLAVITYDSTRTSLSAVLKQIALAGYDNDQYLSPDATYEQLPVCCKYTRAGKKASLVSTAAAAPTPSTKAAAPAHTLTPVINAYLQLKEALVNSAAADAATQAQTLNAALQAVNMTALAHEQHTAWMAEKNTLTEIAAAIAAQKDLEKQRKQLALLSPHLYNVVKAGGVGETLFYQHCPMFENGADWLSREKPIRNPYYGSEMLTCGKTTATIP